MSGITTAMREFPSGGWDLLSSLDDPLSWLLLFDHAPDSSRLDRIKVQIRALSATMSELDLTEYASDDDDSADEYEEQQEVPVRVKAEKGTAAKESKVNRLKLVRCSY
jgi:hypothetical protein